MPTRISMSRTMRRIYRLSSTTRADRSGKVGVAIIAGSVSTDQRLSTINLAVSLTEMVNVNSPSTATRRRGSVALPRERSTCMSTELLFRDDAYLREAEGRIVAATRPPRSRPDSVLRAGRRQPGDRGRLVREDGGEIAILDTVYAPTSARSCTASRRAPLCRRRASGSGSSSTGRCATPACGSTPPCTCSRSPSPTVTGGAIGDGEGRLDFDIPDCRPRQGSGDGAPAGDDRPGCRRDDALDQRRGLSANPGLVKTMSVKPPMGSGRVRLWRSRASTSSPAAAPMCTARARSATATVTAIEKKGKQKPARAAVARARTPSRGGPRALASAAILCSKDATSSQTGLFPRCLRRLYEWILALAARPSLPTRSARSPLRRARSSRSRRT